MKHIKIKLRGGKGDNNPCYNSNNNNNNNKLLKEVEGLGGKPTDRKSAKERLIFTFFIWK